MAKVLTFELDHQTKGALRYAEKLPGGSLAKAPNDSGAVIGTLYIRQSACNGKGFPRQLTVTIEELE